MISLQSYEPPSATPLMDECEKLVAIRKIATWCGYQDDGQGGYLCLWTLTQEIPGHPVNSTVDQSTIEHALFGERGEFA